MNGTPETTKAIEVHSLKIACDGGTLGHPRVFLTIRPEVRETVCPYCSLHYILKQGANPVAAH